MGVPEEAAIFQLAPQDRVEMELVAELPSQAQPVLGVEQLIAGDVVEGSREIELADEITATDLDRQLVDGEHFEHGAQDEQPPGGEADFENDDDDCHRASLR